MNNNRKNTWDSSVKQWLNNFTGEDLYIAQVLLEQLDIHSSQKIQNNIRETLQNIIYKSHSNEYFLLLPLISTKQVNNLEQKDSQIKPWDYGTEKHYPVAFGDFLPGAQKISIAPGSEGPVGHWVRNISYNLGDKKYKILPSDKSDYYFLSRLVSEGKKVRIICVTDMSLSGNEAIGYGSTLNLSPIKKLFPENITIELFCYGISAIALKKLRDSKYFDRIIYKYFTRSLREIKWIPFGEHNAIRKLCINLGSRKITEKKKKDILGYKNSGNLTITDTFIPNNTPLIFYPREDLQELGFQWLFPNRYSVRPERPILTADDKLNKTLKYINAGSSGIQYFKKSGTPEKRHEYVILNYLLKKKLQSGHKLKGDPNVISDYLKVYFSDLCIFTGSDSYRMSNYLSALNRRGLVQFDSNINNILDPSDIIDSNPLINLADRIESSQDLPFDRNKFTGNRKKGIHGFDRTNNLYYPLS